MRKVLLLLMFAVVSACAVTAQFHLLTEDSLRHLLKDEYRNPSTMRNSVGLELLERTLPQNPAFDSLKNILISESENSRDRAEMCRVNLGIAVTYLGYGQVYDYALKARPYIERAAAIAGESGLDLYKAGVQLQWANFYIVAAQLQKALDCNNRAIAIALGIGNDSLLSIAYSSLAFTNDHLGNKLARFQALLSARTYADRSNLLSLKARCLLNLAVFYRDAEQMEKSRDFYMQVVEMGEKEKHWNYVIEARRGLGLTYRIQHQKELAIASFDSALNLADKYSLKQEKESTAIDLLNYYFNEETPDKGLAYLAANPYLEEFIQDIGVGYQINKVYASKYEQKGDYDSALYYLKIAAPFELNQPQNFIEKLEFSRLWAQVLDKSGRRQEALQHWLMAKNYADSSGDLDKQKDMSLDLDSAYLALGDFKKAFAFYSRYNYFRDTLETLGQQKDLINAEIEDAGKRAEQEKKQREDEIRRRDNLEYLGITAAIATLFIILIVLGVFRISVAAIRALGFFAFIFLFEFIILLLDKQIHEITHGEPWKVLAIKIVLIAMLLPLHHYLEHRAVHFLTSKAHMLRKNFRGFRKTDLPEERET
jgi:tetratricopeptide (TPR) repeat protein